MIKVYTEDDHLSKVDDNMKELYGDLKSAILSLGKDIELRPKKFYIAFQRKQGFAGLDFLKSNLKVYFNINFFDIQALKNARDVTKVGHHSHGNTGEIPYILTLIKQAYEKS